ncbi:hypothetical protein GQ53DRAFT_382111 [Thozetella sp. PMI_491]|nr:hypothetical protein GQ53DRAFT_382111 [Thozetella sp. PMI_491]
MALLAWDLVDRTMLLGLPGPCTWCRVLLGVSSPSLPPSTLAWTVQQCRLASGPTGDFHRQELPASTLKAPLDTPA